MREIGSPSDVGFDNGVEFIDAITDYIQNKIYFRVKPSDNHGVGLFAIKDIPKGTNIIEGLPFNITKPFYVKLPRIILKDTHPNVVKLIKDMNLNFTSKFYDKIDKFNNSGYFTYWLYPYKEYIYIEFMNHSKDPNLNCVIDKFNEKIYTIRDVKEGEELTTDYTNRLVFWHEPTKEDLEEQNA